MKLLGRVSSVLAVRGIEHALIGAAALAVHGIARATADLDLLAVDAACLEERNWGELRSSGVAVEIRRGDESDPLAGVVRVASPGERTVDVVVGKSAWQRDVVARSTRVQIGSVAIPVVDAPDLILLKLYAGGSFDLRDVEQLLDLDASLVAAVDARIRPLPADCAALWRRIRRQRT